MTRSKHAATGRHTSGNGRGAWRRQLVGLLAAVTAAGTLAGCATPVVVGGAAASGAAVAHDRRTAGTVIDDQGIEFKAGSRLGEDAELAEAHINVTSYNGIVLLSGEAPNPAARARAVSIVEQIPKVRRVHNELVVAEPAPAGDRSHDTWITTKVKSKFVANERLDPTRVKVVTERDVVYLMGLVTRGEAEVAVMEARTTNGVKKVVKLFEYID